MLHRLCGPPSRNKTASIKYCSKEDTKTGKIYANFDYDTVTQPKIRISKEEQIKKNLEHDIMIIDTYGLKEFMGAENYKELTFLDPIIYCFPDLSLG